MTTKSKKRSGRAPGAANTGAPTTVVVKQKGTGKPNSRTARGGTTASDPEDVKKVCALVDPFCSHAIGAKFMSFTMARTLSIPAHYRHSLLTTGTGVGSIFVLPNYYYQPYAVATFPGISDFIAHFENFEVLAGNPTALAARCVTFGVKVRYIGAPLYASGVVRIRVFNIRDGSSLNSVDIATYNCDQYADIPCSALINREVSIILCRTTPDVQTFRTPGTMTPSASVLVWASPGFQSVMVSIDGGQVDSNVLELEYFHNWEIQLPDSDNLAIIATPSPPNVPRLVDAINMITSSTKAIYHEESQKVSNYLKDEAKKALRSTLRAGMASLGV